MTAQQMLIKTTTGKTITLAVEGSDTLDVVKAKIKSVVGDCNLEKFDIHWELVAIPKPPRVAAKRQRQGHMVISVRIFCGMTITKTITMDEFGKSSGIYKLMERIMSNERILMFRQNIFFAGMLLEQDHTFGHYNIGDGSTLDLVLDTMAGGGLMKISAKAIDGKVIPLVIEADEEVDYTIRRVKAMIHDKSGVPADAQRLVYSGDELDDDDLTLQSYYIQNGSVLHLLGDERRTCNICVQIVATQKFIHLKLVSTDTIHTVKAKIEEEEGIPVSQQVLFFPQKRLQEDTFTLADYYIPSESTLYLAQIVGETQHLQ